MFSTLVLLWIFILLIDQVLRIWYLPYVRAIESGTLTVKPFYVKCFLSTFPRCWKISNKGSIFLHKWFDVGSGLTCVLLLPSLFFISFSAFKMSISDEKYTNSQALLPVVPGFNIPVSQSFYYLSALFLCSFVHEFGHALASFRENVEVEGYGILILAAIPAMFVDLPKEQLFNLPCIQQLRILCAGIWHNFVLTVFGIVLLLLLPLLMNPFFAQGKGVTVVGVDEKSAISSSSVLSVGDEIFMANGCKVNSTLHWKTCLIEIALGSQIGFCVPKQSIETDEAGNNNYCCHQPLSHDVCFQHQLQNSQVIFSCLPSWKILQYQKFCRKNSDCFAERSVCLVPYLDSNISRLVIIEKNKRESFIFMGSVVELFNSVDTISWTSKQTFLSVKIINICETYLKYTASFSAALAIFNMIPCPGLDGVLIWDTLLKWIFQMKPNYLTLMKKMMIGLKVCGMTVIVLNITLGIWNSL